MDCGVQFNLCDAEPRILQNSLVNTMASDDLAFFVARSSSTMIIEFMKNIDPYLSHEVIIRVWHDMYSIYSRKTIYEHMVRPLRLCKSIGNYSIAIMIYFFPWSTVPVQRHCHTRRNGPYYLLWRRRQWVLLPGHRALPVGTLLVLLC